MAKIDRRKLTKKYVTGARDSLMIIATPMPMLVQTTERLVIGAAGKGGVFYPLANGLAKLISQYADMESEALVTSGAAENMQLLQEKRVTLALAQADICWAAAQGQMKNFSEKVAVRALLETTAGYLHIVTLDGLGINTVIDVVGKRVSTGLIGSGTEVKALRVLEAYGIVPNNLGVHLHLDYPEAVKALLAGGLDAFAWDTTLPGKSVMDLALTPGIKIHLLATGEVVPEMVEKYGPFYYSAVIPKNTYPGVNEDVLAVVGKTLLVAHDRMTQEQAYAITKALVEHGSKMIDTPPGAREIALANATAGFSVPFHAGALRYYHDIGLINDLR